MRGPTRLQTAGRHGYSTAYSGPGFWRLRVQDELAVGRVDVIMQPLYKPQLGAEWVKGGRNRPGRISRFALLYRIDIGG